MVAVNFNAQGVKPQTALEAIPSGTYDVIITSTEEKPTSKGDGSSYIEFEMTVQGGQFGGRKVFDRLNIKNSNQQAVDIAYGTLSAICHVCNRIQCGDTRELHGIPFKVVVAKQPRGDTPKGTPPEAIQYTNEVRGYKDQNGNDPGQGGQSGGNQGGGGAPNWANNGGGGNQGQGGQGGQNYGQNNQGQGGGQGNGQNWQGGQNNGGNQGNGQNNQGQQNQGNNGGSPQPPAWANTGAGGGQQNQGGGQDNGQQNNGGQQNVNQGQNNGGGGNFQAGNNPPWANQGQQNNG